MWNFFCSTVDGLAHRFNQLFKKFTLQGKHEHRKELVFLFNELLWQEGINWDEYAQLNNILTESLDDGEEDIELTKDEAAESTILEDETREGKLKKIIWSTDAYLIEHDKKDLLEWINEFRKDVGEYFLDTVLELEELVVNLLNRWGSNYDKNQWSEKKTG